MARDPLHEGTGVADVPREHLDERQAGGIAQRRFVGLSLAAIAAPANLSLATVKRDPRSTRARLTADLRSE